VPRTEYAAIMIVAIAIGVAGIVLGEADDSLGLRLLGVLLVAGVAAFGVRTADAAGSKHSRRRSTDPAVRRRTGARSHRLVRRQPCGTVLQPSSRGSHDCSSNRVQRVVSRDH